MVAAVGRPSLERSQSATWRPGRDLGEGLREDQLGLGQLAVVLVHAVEQVPKEDTEDIADVPTDFPSRNRRCRHRLAILLPPGPVLHADRKRSAVEEREPDVLRQASVVDQGFRVAMAVEHHRSDDLQGFAAVDAFTADPGQLGEGHRVQTKATLEETGHGLDGFGDLGRGGVLVQVLRDLLAIRCQHLLSDTSASLMAPIGDLPTTHCAVATMSGSMAGAGGDAAGQTTVGLKVTEGGTDGHVEGVLTVVSREDGRGPSHVTATRDLIF